MKRKRGSARWVGAQWHLPPSPATGIQSRGLLVGEQLLCHVSPRGHGNPCLRSHTRVKALAELGTGWPCFPFIAPSVHHGPAVAQPIHLDTAQFSPKFISDYLWSLVDTAW